MLTAAHCLDLGNATTTTFSAMKSDGTLESRTGAYVAQLGVTDMAIVQLAGTASSTWPNVTRAMHTAAASGLVSKSIVCYGAGYTGYANPGPGLINPGIWKFLVSASRRRVAAAC